MMPKVGQQARDETIYLGIDPGKSGGLAFITEGFPGGVWYCPTPATENDLWNVVKAAGLNGTQRPIVACVEKVASMHKQGVKSVFAFGQSYGTCRLLLAVLEASWHEVRPLDWMKSLGIPAGAADKKAQKEKLRAYAQRLYPKLPIWSEPKSLGRQRAVADAILLAHYCRQEFGRN